MSRRTALYSVLLGSALLALGGCADVPQDKIQNAQTALEAASKAGAETYAPESWQQARDTMNRAELELQAQAQKVGILRSYSESSELLTQAQTQAEAAAREAVTVREQARQEAESMLESTRSALQQVQDMLVRMPRGKDTRAEIESLQQELAGLQVSLDEAAGMMMSEEYLGARASIDQINASIETIRVDLEAALARAQSGR